ncbi:MAG: pyruvate carboxylase [Deltaproteobacteria bacterium]|nr:pyruvate carboxylase [Deltaproteobacteria bacterium]
MTKTKIRRLLVANRGEIAIRIFRAATELGIRTVAIYSEEDRFSLHRYKADEAYLIGKGKGPVEAYLDIPSVIALAKEKNVDAIHPGYGFLSENFHFAKACREAGIVFVGPEAETIEAMGDKQKARKIAVAAGVPVVPGPLDPVADEDHARKICADIGYPVMIKALGGGGGRGMRRVDSERELADALRSASSEAKAAFGRPEVFIEKRVDAARHIEVQVLGDKHGNLVHLFERDCTIQRRHQKVIEIAPALNLPEGLASKLHDWALAIARHVRYENAGTVEFLVDATGTPFFIEVNPRIQVEHTVTEEITGRDLVQAQILIAEGRPLSDPAIGITGQDSITMRGVALQCRVTTEDPANGFMPDTGKIQAYRSGAGFGIRMDGGTGGEGHQVSLAYDSLLVKITARGLTFPAAVAKVRRSVSEFRVRGVKTNTPFLENVLRHPLFLEGKATTTFIDEHPELFEYPQRKNRASKLLTYLAEVTVNGHPSVKAKKGDRQFFEAHLPDLTAAPPPPEGSRQMLERLGAAGLAAWVKDQQRLLITDTTFRDAHQSLLATRVRSYDLLRAAPATSHILSQAFSLEMWGGATFDVAYRFLSESPWQRLEKMRAAIPNVLFQMLLRGSNAVGYTAYPDNVVRMFIQQAAQKGIDLFRVFDSLNWVENMKVSIEECLKTGKLVEGAISYTGDITDPKRKKYDLDYYMKMARELESLGVHMIAIKDMAGLCKPYAAEKLIKAMKAEIKVPIHFHTHDTSGNGLSALMKAAEAGVDIVDVAIGTMSGTTSQPNLNSLNEALRGTPRELGFDPAGLQHLSSYWETVRQYYFPFEAGLQAAAADVYVHEIPGGQYSNLKQQAESVGLGHRWEEVKQRYAEVNLAFGDIVKVTPTSKAVGDMALALVSSNLPITALDDDSVTVSFPDSVVSLFSGHMGQALGGFPEKLQKRILGGKAPLTERPGASLPPTDVEAVREKVREHHGVLLRDDELTGALLYPKVMDGFLNHQTRFSDTSMMDTPTFFYGLRPGEETQIEIEAGKRLIITLLTVGELKEGGKRTVFFDLNGRPREVVIHDHTVPEDNLVRRKADSHNPFHVAAPMPGKLTRIEVRQGQKVLKGELLAVTEAMKMENAITAKVDAIVDEILLQPGNTLEGGDLILTLREG